MITNLTSAFNYEEDMIGVVMEDTPVVTFSEPLKVRIPVCMPNIPDGKPTTFSRAINAMSIFKNDPSCRPALSSNIIKEQNYLTAKMYTGKDMNDIITIEKAKDEKSEDKKYVKKGEKVSIGFSNGKLSKIYYETTIYK